MGIEELKKHFFPRLEAMVLEESLNVITCEDILSDEVCATLRKAAEKLKIGAQIVDKFVRDALAEGKRKAAEIIKFIREKMASLSKVKCADILSEDVCAKIAEVAAKVKVEMKKVEEVMKKIVAKGIVKVQEIIKKIKEYFFPTEIENVIVCEDILSDEMCATLRKAAEKLKIGAKIVDQYIREALKKGKVKAKEIIKYIEDKMAALSKVKCEDILDEDICKKVREVAAKVKVEMKKVEEVMKKIVAKGIVKVQEIIKKIKEYFFPSELENALVCEEILSDKVCAALRKAAEKLKIGAKIVDDLIRKALEKGYRKASDIIKYICDKMVSMSKIHCTDILSEKACAKIKELAGKVRVKFEKVIAFMKNVVAKGVTKAKEIIKKIHDFFFPGLEFELENEVKCADVLSESLCTKIKAFAEAFKIKYAKIIEVMKTAIAKGLDKISEIIDYIKKHFPHLG